MEPLLDCVEEGKIALLHCYDMALCIQAALVSSILLPSHTPLFRPQCKDLDTPTHR